MNRFCPPPLASSLTASARRPRSPASRAAYGSAKSRSGRPVSFARAAAIQYAVPVTSVTRRP
jgi:hypothetical protein